MLRKLNKFIILCGLFVSLLTAIAGSVSSHPVVTNDLKKILSAASDDDVIPINIRLTQQYDPTKLSQKAVLLADKERRRDFVISELQSFNRSHQNDLLMFLKTMEKTSKVSGIKPFWILNMVHCKATPQVIHALMERSDIKRLDFDEDRLFIPGHTLPGAPMPLQRDKKAEISNKGTAWHVELLNAPQVWEHASGNRGENVVVAVIDTGVNYNHPDLKLNMWEHPDYPLHGYDFVNDDYSPDDLLNHGTSVAGMVAGNGTNGMITGIAPSAKIMALKAMCKTGASESTIFAAIEFAVEHGADVMTLSVGAPQWYADRVAFRTIMDNVKNAGLVATVSAGNYGDSQSVAPPSQIITPACIPPPWLHPDQNLAGGTSAVIAVGSTAQEHTPDSIAPFSSRGPVVWDKEPPYDDYPFNPGIGLIRPDIVAPGNLVPLPCGYDTDFGEYFRINGTSFSAPAAAGTIALMLSKNPMLSPESISRIIEETSFPLSETKDNVFGSGRVDAMAAFTETAYRGMVYLSHGIDDSVGGNGDGNINPGENIHLQLSLKNPTDVAFEQAHAVLRINSEYVTLLDSVVDLGTVSPGETLYLEQAFSFDVDKAAPGGQTIYFSLWIPQAHNESAPLYEYVFPEQVHAPNLILSTLSFDDSHTGNHNGWLDPGEQATARIRIENIGQKPSEQITVHVIPRHPFIKSCTTEMQISPLAQNQHVFAEFPVKVHSDVMPGAPILFDVTAQSGPYEIQRSYQTVIGMLESWHSEDFSRYDWSFSGDAPWEIDANESINGQFSARSGQITHNGFSEFYISIDVLQKDSVSFYRKVSSESNDYLDFYINDKRKGRWSGEKEWERVTFEVAPGQQLLRWIYWKDPVFSGGQDCAWIDHIELPSPAKTWAFAGFDKIYDEWDHVGLHGFASQYDYTEWSSTGSGVLEDPFSLEAAYIPDEEDLHGNQIEMTLTAFYEGEEASHTMLISFGEQVNTDEVLFRESAISVYPNPASASVRVAFYSAGNTPTYVRLLDLSGKMIKYLTVMPSAGWNSKLINLKDVDPGVYLIQLENITMSKTEKLLIY